MYIQVERIIEKKENVGQDLIQSIGCWLNRGRSDCEFAAYVTRTVYVVSQEEWVILFCLNITRWKQKICNKKKMHGWIIYNKIYTTEGVFI